MNKIAFNIEIIIECFISNTFCKHLKFKILSQMDSPKENSPSVLNATLRTENNNNVRLIIESQIF